MSKIAMLAKAAAQKTAGTDLTHAYQTGGEDAVESMGGKQGMGKSQGGVHGTVRQEAPKPQARPPVQVGGAGVPRFGERGSELNKRLMDESVKDSFGASRRPLSVETGATDKSQILDTAAGPAMPKGGLQGKPGAALSELKVPTPKPQPAALGAAPAAKPGIMTSARGILAKGERAIGRGLRAAPGLNRIPSSLGRRGAVAGAAAAGTAGLSALLNSLGGSGGVTPTTAQAAPAAPAAQPVPATAAGGDGAQLAGIGGGNIMQWAKANPGKAALLGLLPVGAYGLSRMLRGRNKDKEAGDYLGDLPRNRRELIKLAGETVQHNTLVIVGHELEKLASEATGQLRQGFRKMHAALLEGGNIYKAASEAFPALKPSQRSVLAKSVVKQAWAALNKAACSTGCSKPKKSNKGSFHGKPQEASAWMSANS